MGGSQTYYAGGGIKCIMLVGDGSADLMGLWLTQFALGQTLPNVSPHRYRRQHFDFVESPTQSARGLVDVLCFFFLLRRKSKGR